MQQMTIAGALALALAMGGTAAAQMTVFPSRGEGLQLPPPGREMKTGTGRIKGRLVAADTGTPVRRAQVRLSGPDVLPKVTTTDQEGRYEFRDLPAGRFTISATKAGHVTVQYGQTRPFEAGKPIELSDGQVLERADIAMPRGSVIAGRIIDEFGDPVAEAAVTAMRSTWSNGRRSLQPAGRTATTNDLGQFRIYGLPPGEYYVSSTLRGTQEMVVTEVRVAMMVTGGPPPDSPRSGYAPTYYPGTPNANQAQKISLGLAQEVQNTDFALVPVPLAKVSGTVIGSNGLPLQGVMISAAPKNADSSAIVMPFGASARTDANGHFTLSGVAPGEYTLNARTTQVMTSSGGNRTMFAVRMAGPGGDGQSEFGSVPLSVSGEDVSNVTIVTSKGTTVSGRVIYEGDAKPKVNRLRISAQSPDADGPLGMLGGSSSVTEDDTFEIRGVAGPRLFRVMNLPAGWVLKGVRLNGADVTDTGIHVGPGEPVTGLEVVLTSKTTEITGSVKTGTGPATDYTVVIFSDDPSKWTIPGTRYIASARPTQAGTFQVKNLPPGGYYAIAVEYIAQGDWYDPEVLQRLRANATSVRLEEGAVETLNLTLHTGS